MKLRYYADAPDFDDHEQIIDLLYTISDKYGITVEIERVLGVDRDKVDDALDVTELSESDVYEIKESEYVRKAEVDALSYPAAATAVVTAVGDSEIQTESNQYTVAELLPETPIERFDSPEAVRRRLQRPTVATAMKRVIETAATLDNPEFGSSQREAYEKTFRELRAIDVDGGVDAVADWIVERIHETKQLPGSRGVRREAANVCRKNGHEIRNDEWLGI